MALDKGLADAAKQVGRNAAKVGLTIGGTTGPVAEQRELIAAIMADIGIVQGVPLEVAGTHLGAIIGGGVAMGINPANWPNALMSLYSGGEHARYLLEGTDRNGMSDRAEFVDATKEIARACLCTIEGCVSLTVKDHAAAMRKYLEFLAGIVGQASLALAGD